MNVPLQGAGGPEIVTQESLLLGAAERISRIRDGRLAIHFHLSRLKPQNRQEGHIRIALRMLEPMVNAYRGQMFLLSNSDVVFMLKDANITDVENMVFRLRALFSKDPLTFGDSGDGADAFCTWYDLASRDYDHFVAMARDATSEARVRSRDKAKAGPETRPIDAKALSEILTHLARLDVSGLIRRQSAIVISQTNATVLFQEFWVALAELQKALAPEINLLGNRWLFQHLSQGLDARVLTALTNTKLQVQPIRYNLNMNISSVLGPHFEKFETSLGDASAISLEFQILDVLADSRGFYSARSRLRDRGHQIVIDGLNELTLQFMDVTQFDADLYKLTWSREMREGEHGDSVAAAIQPLGMDKVLLARCDTEAAISWGLEQGVQRFQGMYVDAMLAAYAMQSCETPGKCSLQQCVSRRSVIAGPLRAECCNIAVLDASPTLVAPKSRHRQETPS